MEIVSFHHLMIIKGSDRYLKGGLSLSVKRFPPFQHKIDISQDQTKKMESVSQVEDSRVPMII